MSLSFIKIYPKNPTGFIDDPFVPKELVDWHGARRSPAFRRLEIIRCWSRDAANRFLDPLTSPVWLPQLPWSEEELACLSNLSKRNHMHQDDQKVTLPSSLLYLPRHVTSFEKLSLPVLPACASCCESKSADTSPALSHPSHDVPALVLAQIMSLAPPTPHVTYLNVFRIEKEKQFFVRCNPIICCPFAIAWGGNEDGNELYFLAPPRSDLGHTISKVLSTHHFRGILLFMSEWYKGDMPFSDVTTITHGDWCAVYIGLEISGLRAEFSVESLATSPHIEPVSRSTLLPWLSIAPYIGCLSSLLHGVIAGFALGRSLRLPRGPLSLLSKIVPDYESDATERGIILKYDQECLRKGFVHLLGPRPPYLANRSAPRFVNYRRIDRKSRVVVDHSATQVNATSWATGIQRNTSRDDICRAISDCGYGTLLVVCDVVGAYKNVKLAPFDWPYALEKSELGFLQELRHQWGARAAGFAWEPTARLFRLFMTIILLQYAAHYVDDYTIIIRGSFDFSQARKVVALVTYTAQLLGLQLAKFQMGAKCNILGANIDLWSGKVTIPEARWRITILDIRRVTSVSSCSARTLAGVAGSLVYFSMVHRSVRCFLPPLFKAIAARVATGGWNAVTRVSGKLRDHLTRLLRLAAGESQAGDVAARSSLLKNVFLMHKAVYIYTDASCVALGLVFTDLAEIISIPLSAEVVQRYFVEKRISIPGLEALEIVVALLLRCSRSPRARRITIFTDSAVFICSWRKGYSDAPLIQEAIINVERICCEFSIDLDILYIHTLFNPADYPSKNFAPPETNLMISKIGGGDRAVWTADTRNLPTWVMRWLNWESHQLQALE